MSWSDPIDQGSHLAQVHADAAIAAHAAKMKPEQKQVLVERDGVEVLEWEQLECEDCGLAIEPERLAMARVRCFKCQDAKEKREKQYARR